MIGLFYVAAENNPGCLEGRVRLVPATAQLSDSPSCRCCQLFRGNQQHKSSTRERSLICEGRQRIRPDTSVP